MKKSEIAIIVLLICVLGWGFYLMISVVEEVTNKPLQNDSKINGTPTPNQVESGIESNSNEVITNTQPSINKNSSNTVIVKNVSDSYIPDNSNTHEVI